MLWAGDWKRPYDYGVGGRLGKFWESTLLQMYLGADYEWGKDSAKQTTFSVGVEKFFYNQPFSVAVNFEHYRKSGGLDPSALFPPKRFFGAARKIENGGSLTILATALIDTGSKMDEVIFEEFKGTGNSEIHLDRKLMEKRIFPCMDINKSGTRKEDLLYDKGTLTKVWVLRKILSPMGVMDGMEFLLDKLKDSKTNDDFFDRMNKP